MRDGPSCPGSLCPDGCPNPCSPALAFFNYNIIFCQRQVLVERPTLTSEMVEQSCGFQCFCTKPQGNMGGTKPLEPLMRKKRRRNANFFMLFGKWCSTCILWYIWETRIFHVFHVSLVKCRHTFMMLSFFVAKWLKDLVCHRAMTRLGIIDAFAEPRRL